MTAVTKPNYSLRKFPSGVWALVFISILAGACFVFLALAGLLGVRGRRRQMVIE
jgi:hypothetical protein